MTPKRAIVYVRLSIHGEEEESIKCQREVCERIPKHIAEASHSD